MQIQREIEQPLIDLIVSVTGASSILSQTTIQSLWSGYGQIVRLHLNSQNTVQIQEIVGATLQIIIIDKMTNELII